MASQPGYKSEPDETINDTDHPNPTLAIPDMTVSGPTDPPQSGGNTGVGMAPVLESTGVDTEPGRNTVTEFQSKRTLSNPNPNG